TARHCPRAAWPAPCRSSRPSCPRRERWHTRAGPGRCRAPLRTARRGARAPTARAWRGARAGSGCRARVRAAQDPCSADQGRLPGRAMGDALLDLVEGLDAVPEHLPLFLLVAAVGLGVVEDVDLVVMA